MMGFTFSTIWILMILVAKFLPTHISHSKMIFKLAQTYSSTSQTHHPTYPSTQPYSPPTQLQIHSHILKLHSPPTTHHPSIKIAPPPTNPHLCKMGGTHFWLSPTPKVGWRTLHRNLYIGETYSIYMENYSTPLYPTSEYYDLELGETQILSSHFETHYHSNPIPYPDIYTLTNLTYETSPTIFSIIDFPTNDKIAIYLNSQTLEIVEVGVIPTESDPHLWIPEITPSFTIWHPL